jgi:hypothetical protein
VKHSLASSDDRYTASSPVSASDDHHSCGNVNAVLSQLGSSTSVSRNDGQLIACDHRYSSLGRSLDMARVGVVALLLLASAALAAAGSSSTTSQCTTQRPGMSNSHVALHFQAVRFCHNCGMRAVCHLNDCAQNWCTAGLALTLYRYKPELFPQSGGFNVNSPFNVRCFLANSSSNVTTASAVDVV